MFSRLYYGYVLPIPSLLNNVDNALAHRTTMTVHKFSEQHWIFTHPFLGKFAGSVRMKSGYDGAPFYLVECKTLAEIGSRID